MRALAVATTLLAAGAIIALVWGVIPAAEGSTNATAAGRACSAADLQLTVGATGAYRGSATQDLTLTNHATDACFLPGAPSTRAMFDDGSQQDADMGQFATSRADLQPGQSAVLLVGAPGTCTGADGSRSRVATRMALRLTRGDTLQARGAYLDVQCGRPSVILFAANP